MRIANCEITKNAIYCDGREYSISGLAVNLAFYLIGKKELCTSPYIDIIYIAETRGLLPLLVDIVGNIEKIKTKAERIKWRIDRYYVDEEGDVYIVLGKDLRKIIRGEVVKTVLTIAKKYGMPTYTDIMNIARIGPRLAKEVRTFLSKLAVSGKSQEIYGIEFYPSRKKRVVITASVHYDPNEGSLVYVDEKGRVRGKISSVKLEEIERAVIECNENPRCVAEKLGIAVSTARKYIHLISKLAKIRGIV